MYRLQSNSNYQIIRINDDINVLKRNLWMAFFSVRYGLECTQMEDQLQYTKATNNLATFSNK